MVLSDLSIKRPVFAAVLMIALVTLGTFSYRRLAIDIPGAVGGASAYVGFTGGTGYAWMPYGSLPRKGLLAHGSVLSQGTKFADSSPTQRGIFIRTRLLCQTIPPPPPSVNVASCDAKAVELVKLHAALHEHRGAFSQDQPRAVPRGRSACFGRSA